MEDIAILLPNTIWKVDKIVKICKMHKYSRFIFLWHFV